MKRYFLNILIVLCALVGTTNKANAETITKTITKTYLFSGETAGSQTTFQGYFYEEGIPNAHYTCFPNPWTYGSTDYIHATLKDGITNGARLFFNGDASGITTMSDVRCKMSDVWYDLSGRKLSGQPTKPGLYINKGKKVNR